jgi:hypothetical protein
MRTIHTAALIALSMLAGCGSQEKSSLPPQTAADVQDQIVERVRGLSPGFPTATISPVEMTEDWRVACGTISFPGKPSHVFMSMDSEPRDGERAVAMPSLIDDASWSSKAAGKQSAIHLLMCQDNGLLD